MVCSLTPEPCFPDSEMNLVWTILLNAIRMKKIRKTKEV